jgi:hypothetical protein
MNIGDKVKCVNAVWGLELGKIYTVQAIQIGIENINFFHLIEKYSCISFCENLFEKVEQ